jgi:diaminohydroxyphosphoribosylaminopyrimidine deaminase / 5-amino-6-(5-phosphoribosylamino)uracil reductase
MSQASDIHFMRHALSLARRGLGRTWPNPSVGCVIVKNDHVIAQGRTVDGGRPHAEVAALSKAGASARGATLYVTLEPCAHHGKTPPCVDAIIEAGVARVVIGTADINPRVNGQGFSALKAAGIDVSMGVLAQECGDFYQSFFLRFLENRPYITLKTACSLDGKIALGNGKSQWITGDMARLHAHGLRARHDATLVGIGTVLADDPMLSTRVDGVVHKPVRIVLDSNLAVPLDSKLVSSAMDLPLWIFYQNADEQKKSALERAGVRLFQVEGKDLKPILGILAEQGITRVLVEGGSGAHSTFWQQGYYDSLYIYRAGRILGGDAKAAFGALNLMDLAAAVQSLSLREVRVLGQDLLEIYERKR